jgi:hypothetical protein
LQVCGCERFKAGNAADIEEDEVCAGGADIAFYVGDR